ncbi:unnamed protein product [Danaus chrysippus]|uniref:(African queen) hypothetical protein n=1 Tax=Danaus chrysippus TaxID=151541 RepID=A0A8J2QV57_9NEOP|nr:unnamed protein product [Danaus chrysippus]
MVHTTPERTRFIQFVYLRAPPRRSGQGRSPSAAPNTPKLPSYGPRAIHNGSGGAEGHMLAPRGGETFAPTTNSSVVYSNYVTPV